MVKEKRRMVHVLGMRIHKYGSLEKWLLELAKQCQDRNWELTVVCEAPVTDQTLRQELSRWHTPLVVLPSRRGYRDSRIKTVLRFSKLIKKTKPLIITSYFMPAGYFATMAALLHRVPLNFYWVHGPWLDKVSRKSHFIRMTHAYFVDGIASVSNGVSESILKQGVPKRKILPTQYLGVNLSAFENIKPSWRKEVRDELKIPEEAVVAVTVARHEEQKGLDYLIEAMPNILQRCHDIYFLWVGEGSLTGILKKRAQELKVLDRIIFAGVRNDVNRLLSASDLMILPSRWEGLGLVLVEAAAAGLPIVASRIVGIMEACSEGQNSLLVQAGDIKALADAISQVVLEPTLRRKMAVAGRKHAKKFEMSLTVTSFLNFCEQELKDREILP